MPQVANYWNQCNSTTSLLQCFRTSPLFCLFSCRSTPLEHQLLCSLLLSDRSQRHEVRIDLLIDYETTLGKDNSQKCPGHWSDSASHCWNRELEMETASRPSLETKTVSVQGSDKSCLIRRWDIVVVVVVAAFRIRFNRSSLLSLLLCTYRLSTLTISSCARACVCICDGPVDPVVRLRARIKTWNELVLIANCAFGARRLFPPSSDPDWPKTFWPWLESCRGGWGFSVKECPLPTFSSCLPSLRSSPERDPSLNIGCHLWVCVFHCPLAACVPCTFVSHVSHRASPSVRFLIYLGFPGPSSSLPLFLSSYRI